MTLQIQEQNKAFNLLKELIGDLGAELHWPSSRVLALTPNTSLDRDLGLDSLSRVELAGRVERRFGVVLGEQMFLRIETVADLLDAIKSAPTYEVSPGASEPLTEITHRMGLSDIELPMTAKTIVEVLEWHAQRNPNRLHSFFMKSEKKFEKITYADLYGKTLNAASAFVAFGVKKGDAVAIMLPTSLEYFYSFLGAIFCGGVPVAIYPPVRPSQLVEHVQRHAEILKNANAKLLVTDTPSLGRISQLLSIGLEGFRIVDAKRDLLASNSKEAPVITMPQDRAFIQYTSGSTGSPKGVILSHANILANIRAMGEVLQASSKDIFVSWLPLYHDMGLIGAWLGSLYYGCAFVVMSPFSFLSRPKIWLETIHKFRGTLTAAPNFAFELCLKHITEEEARAFDLSTLRALCNGAEPVSAKTVLRFNERFKSSKLAPSALLPVYGLAESTVGLSFPHLGSGAKIDVIDREKIGRLTIAEPLDPSKGETIEFVSCGFPLPGHEIRIVDDSGHEVSERREGRIQFKGPSSTSGYLNLESENRKLFKGEWLETGDLGYMADGEIFVTGRIKDLIKRAGRNVHPEELELVIGDIPGVRKGCVAVFGITDPNFGTERLVVVAETREEEPDRRESIRQGINTKLMDILGFASDQVKLVKPHALLKTSSGKLRRSACKILYLKNELDVSQWRLKIQLLRFAIGSFLLRIKSNLKLILEILRSVRVWFFVVLTTLVVWPFVVFLPTINSRWFAARLTAKISLWLAGVRLITAGQQNKNQAVFVANHASYSDVIYLLAGLRYPVSFVAKAELKRNIPVKLTLDRLGVIYVERYELAASLRDAEYTTKMAKTGKSLLSFPEGTFTRASGLLPFHVGPFLTAVECDLPVVPITIAGARSILHPGSWLIRRGIVKLEILDPVKLDDGEKVALTKWEKALAIKGKAREVILSKCGEPDLALP
jgi:1-acyl-sn-glycerol-3-phosphate acyltransferase